MSKNPFQILDFLGYFFPGASVMIAFYYFVPTIRESFSITTNTSAIIYIVCIILAYIIGHIVSLLSSITVEKYAIWKYGYPSDYLLNDYEPNRYLSRNKIIENRCISKKRKSFLNFTKTIFKIVIWIGLLPISLIDIILSLAFGADHYYTRKLSGQQITMIKGKSLLLFKSIGIQENDFKIFDGDNHRIIHNYYYENSGKHSARMDNCIAIYDFLRAMTFVFCVVFMIVFIHSFCSIDILLPIDWNRIGILVLLAVLSYVFYMGFLKFYRKFTVENFMCLLCDRNFDFPKYKEPILYTTEAGIQQYTSGQDLTISK